MRINRFVLVILVLVCLFFLVREGSKYFDAYYAVLGLLVLGLGYFIYRSIRLVGTVERLERLIVSLRQVSKESRERLDFLDKTKFFSATDETVMFFDNLKTIQNLIDAYLGDVPSEKEKK